MKKISALMIACAVGMAGHAQTIIDPLTGSVSGYTDTLVNDGGSGGASSVSFTTSSSGLQANFVGTVSDPEQALFLQSASAFSTAFTVGDMLSVSVAVPASGITEDFGLAISATNTPPPAGVNTSTRANFDWASISVRPSQSSVRVNTSISGTLTTGNNVAAVGSTANITALFISWVSADSFQLGYVSNNVAVVDATANFAPGSGIGEAIGFYGDLRASGTSLGNLSNLTITPIPEPSTLALSCVGLAGLFTWVRRKK